jgi:type IV pilus assembly protein PilB
VSAINLRDFVIDPEIIKLVPRAIAEKHLVIPINRVGSTLVVAMCDPANINAVDILKFRTSCNIEAVVASEPAIREAIDRYYEGKTLTLKDIVSPADYVDVEDLKREKQNIDELTRAADDAPVIKLVNLILTDAIKRGASDIHVEPYEKDFRVRFRIDGSLYDVMRPPMGLRNAIINRLKIMAKLDISEHRMPQDGRIKMTLDSGKEMDFRVSVCPMLFGEKVVMRLLDKSNLQLDMTKLGFDSQQLQWFQEAINRPYGMVLVTGPTGSGKTTTLYSALSSLNQEDTNISTAEDPVEFNFAGINQMQVHEDTGLTFPVALRSFLRQDPDIIMIGEIRDFATGEIAVKAALTGRLVLSTLHTNDAPGTVSRLLDMGIAPFLVTASLNLILAQRLCRRLCKDCKRPAANVDEKALIEAGVPPEKVGTFTLYEPVGCRECNDRGYRGRVAVYEVMPFWDGLKELVITAPPPAS